MANFLINAVADNVRFARSKHIAVNSAATYNAIRIPKKGFVKEIYFTVVGAFTAGTVSVGFIGNGETADTDFFASALDASLDLTSVGTVKLGVSKWFNAGNGTITMTVADMAGSSGILYLFAEYSVIS